jgi:hypothetical protein
MTDQFVRAYHTAIPCHTEHAGNLCAIVRDDLRKAIVLGHPLWLHDNRFLNETQAEAVDILRTDLHVAEVGVSDLFVLDRTPARIFHDLHGPA